MRREDSELPQAPKNDRPHDRYRCGLPCGGPGESRNCPLGPTSSGACRREGTLCNPVLSASRRQRRRTLGLMSVGIMVMIVGFSVWDRDFAKPGELSTPHAQILTGQLSTTSCAACHPQAESSLANWFQSGHADSAALVQTDRCLDCHHNRLPRDKARLAHNQTRDALRELRDQNNRVTNVTWQHWLNSPAIEQDDIACATCHREHGGASASLTSLSDAQCQTCHSQQFSSFAVDHPPWNQWPYRASESIAFDHASHAQRHFPAKRDQQGNASAFDCAACHTKTATGNFARSSSYEQSCGDCHDRALNQQTSERLDLLVLPSLIDPSARIAARWPRAATGFYDGKVGSLARWLLGADNKVNDALAQLPGGGNFGLINPNNATDRDAAETVAKAIFDLMESMSTAGPMATAEKYRPGDLAIKQLLQFLSPQLIEYSTSSWLNNSIDRQSNRIRPIGGGTPFRTAAARTQDDDLLLEDDGSRVDELSPSASTTQDVLKQPLTRGNSNRRRASRFDPLTMLGSGGWYVDDSRMAISYRGNGHADPVLKSAIELAAGLAIDDPIRRELLETGSTSACIQCHQMAITPGPVQWNQSAAAKTDWFTKFEHSPHLNLPVLADCTHCHQVRVVDSMDNAAASMQTVSFAPGASPSHDFEQLQRHTCAACHTANAAGDACVKCHRYHTGGDSAPSRP